MNFNTKFKRNKGITLIALVVTIIVLLILAGISIMMLTGQNGILNRANEAKENTGTSQTEELVKLSVTDALTQGLGSLTDANLKAALDNNLGAGKYTITGDDTNGWTVTVDGKEFKVDATRGEDLSAYQTNETKPYLPDSTKFERIEGTDLTTGLVIKEKATGSEYVWVEVPKTEAVYQTAGVNVTNFDDNYTKIENDLHEYTKFYRGNTECSDTFYDASEDSNEANKSDWFQSEDAYNTAKKRMLRSVYENGGFWVGRYEAGIGTHRESSGVATTMPLSKKNLWPYTYVTRTQAKILAEQVESGSHTSSLMFGVQWDLVFEYIKTKKVSKVTDIKTKLNSGSTPIGIYYNNLWNITNTNVEYSISSGNKDSATSVYLKTGADESSSLMNIYDTRENVWEWMLERGSSINYPCVTRGGSYNYGGALYRADYERFSQSTSDSFDSIGFRVSLY